MQATDHEKRVASILTHQFWKFSGPFRVVGSVARLRLIICILVYQGIFIIDKYRTNIQHRREAGPSRANSAFTFTSPPYQGWYQRRLQTCPPYSILRHA